ncbi:MAG: helix-turn-helix domain-containing protein [bacterium]|nr:helix-turn-helix domain-containing protein [bacterium]
MSKQPTLAPVSGEILTREEVAVLLRVHVATLDRWHADREGPPRHQPGGKRARVFYLRTEVEAWAFGGAA